MNETYGDIFIKKLRSIADCVPDEDAKIINEAAAHLSVAWMNPAKPDFQSVTNYPLSDARDFVMYTRYWK